MFAKSFCDRCTKPYYVLLAQVNPAGRSEYDIYKLLKDETSVLDWHHAYDHLFKIILDRIVRSVYSAIRNFNSYIEYWPNTIDADRHKIKQTGGGAARQEMKQINGQIYLDIRLGTW